MDAYATANDTDITFIVSSGEAGALEDGVYTRNKTTGMIARTDLLNESDEFIKGQVVQIGSSQAGRMSGWKFKLISDSDPTLGTDLIKYKIIDTNPIGDATVTLTKLASDAIAKFATKTEFVIESKMTVPALSKQNNTPLSINHGMKLTAPPFIIEHFSDGAGNFTGAADVATESFGKDLGDTVDASGNLTSTGILKLTSSDSQDRVITVRLTGVPL